MAREVAHSAGSGGAGVETLFGESRRQQILKTVRTRGSASVSELAAVLGVSPSTIRRDVKWLAAHELIAHTWGGVVTTDSLLRKRAEAFDLAGRELEFRVQKEAIAQQAAELVTDGDTIIIDAGSTTELLAPHLYERRGLTVITSSLPVAWLLRGQSDIQVIVTGGRVSPRGASMDGMLTEHALGQLYVDTTFLGARGVSIQDGLTNPVLEEIPVKRLMIRAAKRVVLLADSSKWGRTFVGLIAPLTSVQVAITDDGVPGSMRHEVATAGIEVLVAH